MATSADAHHAAVRKELKRHGGREVDTAGDGFFVNFGSPAAAVRCAFAIVTGVREIGLDMRAGLHIRFHSRSRPRGTWANSNGN
jgi:class 3 adenylate cyclase